MNKIFYSSIKMDVLVASNENSALISTVNSADQSQILPFNYALEKNIPAHGLQVVTHDPVSGTGDTMGTTYDFDINKYGYLRSLILEIKTAAGSNNTNVATKLGGLAYIESIELLSSGRRLQYMSRDAYLCALSDLPYGARKSVQAACQMGTSGWLAANKQPTFHIPILFSFFDNVRNTINARFNEALRLRVTLTSDKFAQGTFTTGNNATAASTGISHLKLLAEYRRLPMPLDDKVVQEDFGDNQPLTKVVYDYSEETAATVTLPTSDETSYTDIEIKDNGAVDAIYLIVKPAAPTGSSIDNNTQMVAAGVPLEIKEVKFSASGQTIMEVSGNYIEFLGRRTLDKGFYGGGFDVTADGSGTNFVYKIQLGLDSDTRYFSNLASLRELNTPTISFKIAGTSGVVTAGGTAKVIVRKAMLMTTDAGSGKNSVGVSN